MIHSERTGPNDKQPVPLKMVNFNKTIATFGAEAKVKLTNPSATGEPEDQLRAPLERLTIREV